MIKCCLVLPSSDCSLLVDFVSMINVVDILTFKMLWLFDISPLMWQLPKLEKRKTRICLDITYQNCFEMRYLLALSFWVIVKNVFVDSIGYAFHRSFITAQFWTNIVVLFVCVCTFIPSCVRGEASDNSNVEALVTLIPYVLLFILALNTR